MEIGKLEAIWLKRMRRGSMDARERATLRAGLGLAGNIDQGGKRQVTVISRERWEAVTAELGAPLDPSARRANLLVFGLSLAESRGRILAVGPCRLRILGETRPCERMNEAWPGLEAALRPAWSGGVSAEVFDGGEIAVGDVVRWGAETPFPGPGSESSGKILPEN